MTGNISCNFILEYVKKYVKFCLFFFFDFFKFVAIMRLLSSNI
uniref:Uncharacterized protein n=1 Tax=uncultured prokaryote TaxID=198431 RepID=A0A0H5QJS2_9ZZZZ|nr:hypothetical protein [uncultured prokaryote]